MEESKKVDRKRRRFAARLNSSKGIKSTETPCCNIILYNIGQATGLEKAHIFKLLECNKLDIPPPKYIAEKGETHSFLVFDNIENAVLFYNILNGKAKLDNNGTLIYMSFVEKVPNTELIYQNEVPKGLTLLNDFITSAEEEEFIKLFDWTPVISNLKNRQVKHYGFEFRYGSNDVDLNSPLLEKIPEQCNILWKRLTEFGYELGIPDQLTVNKYYPGQGIPSHVDKHSPFGDTILSLSLGSDVVMEWRHHSGKHIPLVVKARSMLVMQHETRYDWCHGIKCSRCDVISGETVTRGTRLSLTFRWTREGPCTCAYSTMCDSTQYNVHIQDEIASRIEDIHVHQVYDQIASHFSTTRHKPWPRVVQFMRDVTTGSIVYDLGSGNGKNVILNRNDIIQIACERSLGLLAECRERTSRVGSVECVRMDILRATLADCTADVVLCVAVIHHFSTKVRRLQAISTIHRLLRKGGRALITVWAKDQTKSNYLKKQEDQVLGDESRVTVEGVHLPVHENRTQFKHKDLLVPWKLRTLNQNKLSDKAENTLLRYYHVFDENELDQLCKQVDFVIETSFYEEGNWCVICKKI